MITKDQDIDFTYDKNNFVVLAYSRVKEITIP